MSVPAYQDILAEVVSYQPMTEASSSIVGNYVRHDSVMSEPPRSAPRQSRQFQFEEERTMRPTRQESLMHAGVSDS